MITPVTPSFWIRRPVLVPRPRSVLGSLRGRSVERPGRSSWVEWCGRGSGARVHVGGTRRLPLDWVLRTFSIPAGEHRIMWRYSKDAEGSAGSDRAYLDQVVMSVSDPEDDAPPPTGEANGGGDVVDPVPRVRDGLCREAAGDIADPDLTSPALVPRTLPPWRNT